MGVGGEVGGGVLYTCGGGGVLVIFCLFPAGTILLDVFVCFGELAVSSFFSFFTLPIIDGAMEAFLICFLSISVFTARVTPDFGPFISFACFLFLI